MSLKPSLKAFIRESLLQDDRPAEIADDEPLLQRGILDSVGILEVTRFIEEQTGLRIPDQEMHIDNFQTLSSIERMITRLVEDAPGRS